jgi:hypothetical protein
MKCLVLSIERRINHLYSYGERWLTQEIKLEKHPAVMDAAVLAIEAYAKTLDMAWHDSIKVIDYCNEIATIIAKEYPHSAIEDAGQVSYTQCMEHGKIGRHTVCKLGRYVAKHFPALPGDVVETIVVKYKQANAMNFRIVTDQELTAAMIRSVAHSCMHRCDHNGTMSWDEENHPYKVYSSRLGWGMAVREDGNGKGKARSIVRLNEKTFIRIYGSDANESHQTIGDDPPLREWLILQGFSTCRNFTGCKIERIPIRGRADFLAPYIDGEVKKAFLDKEDKNALLVNPKGNLSLQNTGGRTSLLYEIREGQTLCSDSTWCPDELVQICVDGRIFRRDRCRFIERRHEWYHSDYCIEIDGKWEYLQDVVSAITFNGSRNYVLKADCQQIKRNGYTQWALNSHLTADFRGELHYTESLIQLTGGIKKGQYALKIKTCTRDRDGAILLKQDAGHFNYHLTPEQWEPMLGDQVKLSEYGLKKYGRSLANPDNVAGIIKSAYNSDQYYCVEWENGYHNSYDENRSLELIATASQLQKRTAQERMATSV